MPPDVAGSGAVPPGARAVTADGAETTSPAVPLIAVTVAAAGAVITVSSTSRCAMTTAARASCTWARCAAMSCGRSLPAVASWFWAVTTACWAFWTETSPDAPVGPLLLLGGVEARSATRPRRPRPARRPNGRRAGGCTRRRCGRRRARCRRRRRRPAGRRRRAGPPAWSRPGPVPCPRSAAGRPAAPHGLTRGCRGLGRRHDGERLRRPGGDQVLGRHRRHGGGPSAGGRLGRRRWSARWDRGRLAWGPWARWSAPWRVGTAVGAVVPPPVPAVVGATAAWVGAAVVVVARGLARHATGRRRAAPRPGPAPTCRSRAACGRGRWRTGSAEFVASTCRRGRPLDVRALSSEACAASTVLPPSSLFSVAICWLRVAWRWARVWRATVSSIRASTWPGWTRSPTLTSTCVTVPPSANPRLCLPAGAMEPDADTARATVPRSTVTVGGPGSSLPMQADGHDRDRHDEDHGDRDEQEPARRVTPEHRRRSAGLMETLLRQISLGERVTGSAAPRSAAAARRGWPGSRRRPARSAG